MATRKGRTGRKTKRMLTRTKSRRYKVRGGDNKAEKKKLATEIVNLMSALSTANQAIIVAIDNQDSDEYIEQIYQRISDIEEDIKKKRTMLKAMDVMVSPPTLSPKALSLLG